MIAQSSPQAKKGNYMLHWWGGCEPAVAKQIGITDSYLWFATPEERTAMMAKLQHFASLGLVTDCVDGPQTHTKLVTKLILEYQGKRYDLEYDFGYGYPEESGEYMFTEGNYACDCNRANFIREKNPDFPVMECGDRIELTSLSFSRQP